MYNYEDFKQCINGMTGYVVAALTDEYIVDTWPMREASLDEKMDKLLEIRVFNKDREIKMMRSDIGKTFSVLRDLDDNNCIYDDSIEQEHFLDVDTKKSGEQGRRVVQMTGGGKYYLPTGKTQDAKLVIKYYLQKDEESGMPQIVDWRIAGFKEA